MPGTKANSVASAIRRAAKAVGARGAIKATEPIVCCSFCGKSKYEVAQLIAGPTTFICNECIELCEEIIIDESAGERDVQGNSTFIVRVAYNGSLSEAGIKLLPALAEAVQKFIAEKFPGTSLSIASVKATSQGDAIHFAVIAPEKYERRDLTAEIRELTIKLKQEQEKYLLERLNKERLEEQLKMLKIDMFDQIMGKIKKQERDTQTESLHALTMFFDVVGFSRMNDPERQKFLDFLRSIAEFVFRSSEIHINMWGDGIMVVAKDVNHGLRCGCDLISHLNIHGFDVRASANWGIVRFAFNPTLGKRDVDGESVNLSARIEPLADAGELLITEEVFHNSDLNKGDFFFQPKVRSLSKATGSKVVGEEINLYSVRIRNNLSLVSS